MTKIWDNRAASTEHLLQIPYSPYQNERGGLMPAERGRACSD